VVSNMARILSWRRIGAMEDRGNVHFGKKQCRALPC
jgi:hypothetical protein